MLINIAWAAGLFEGEGALRTCQLRLRMNDLDVVKRFQQIVGCGNITNPKIYGDRQQSYEWSIGNKLEVKKILEWFLPYFGDRRAYQALNILDDLELAQ